MIVEMYDRKRLASMIGSALDEHRAHMMEIARSEKRERGRFQAWKSVRDPFQIVVAAPKPDTPRLVLSVEDQGLAFRACGKKSRLASQSLIEMDDL
jgi:hypothetical protein